MSEKHAYNAIPTEYMEDLEGVDMAESSDMSIEETSYNTREEFGDLSKGNDIPEGITEMNFLPEETICFANEEGGQLGLNSDILECMTVNSSPAEQTADFLEEVSRMTVKSSPAEQTADLLEEVSRELSRNDRFLPEQNDSKDVRVTRNPTSVFIGTNYKLTACSRYLSAPWSSCHDLCKLEQIYNTGDPKRHLSSTYRRVLPLIRTNSGANFESKAESKKQVLLRQSSLPSLITEKHGQTHIEDTYHSKKESGCLKMKKIQGEIKPPWASTFRRSSTGCTSDTQAGKKMVVQSRNLSQNSSSSDKEIRTRKEVGSQSEGMKEKAKELNNNPVSLRTPLDTKKPPSVKSRIQKNNQSFSRSENQGKSEEANIKRSVNATEKTLHMFEPSCDKKPAKRAVKLVSSSRSLRNTGKAKEPMSYPCSPKTPTTLKRPPNVKPRPCNNNVKSSSSSKNQNKHEEAKITQTVNVPERTLYMIEPSSARKPIRKASISTSSNKSSYITEPNSDKKSSRRASVSASSEKNLRLSPMTSHVSDDEGSKDNQNDLEIDHLSHSSTSSSTSTISIEDKPCEHQRENQQESDSMDTKQIDTTMADSHLDKNDGSSEMVKFQRTVVSLHVSDTSSKILQSRRGTILEDDQNASNEVVCLKKTELACINDDEKANIEAVCLKKTELTDIQSHDASPEPEKVLLRHQEEVDKNGNLDLNEVIEETASKLIKTRKSKVKALVSAFETLISLHDPKPLVESRVF